MDVEALISPQHVPDIVNENITTEVTSDVEVYDNVAVTVPEIVQEVSSDEDHVAADLEELLFDTATEILLTQLLTIMILKQSSLVLTRPKSSQL